MAPHRSVLDIPLFHKLYDFYKLLDSHYDKIPKTKRYTLWKRCENVTLSILTQLIRTGPLQGEVRVQALQAMSHEVDLLKVLIRLAQDTHTVTPKQYMVMQTSLQEIGKMIGGWLKSVAH